ncbi:GerAB/ArcD/ProY family transporter [Paenibacillus harenae]|uniref:Spore germination protein KB n=1 Tax=Paenibacillus harenae TaxID=306543 RepID=A0ABT9U220_PAEHA|nr:endospore germination permease [Paenibacillus harenae]MDQ0113598.1 spore germination protein KB [Paenibacillus harenae]
MGKTAGLNNSLITSGQAAKILFMFAMGSSTLILPTAVAAIAKQDSWLSFLIAGPINYLVLMIYLALNDRFPRMSLTQYAQKLIGVWAGKALSLTYIFFYLILSALVLRNISDFLGLSVLPQTPGWFINSTFMIVVGYGVFLGIETIVRTGEILFTWGLIIIFVVLVSLSNQFNFHNFEPILYQGLMSPIKGSYPIIGFPIAEFVFFTSILPLITKQGKPKLRKDLKLVIVCLTFASTVMTVFLIGVMGVSEVSRSPFSVYDMAKYINIEEIVVRVEILVAIVWIGTVFMKLVLCVYALTVTTAQVLGLNTYRPLVMPYSVIIVPLSIFIYRNVAHTKEVAAGVWTLYSSVQGILFPLILLFIAVLTGKRDSEYGIFPSPKNTDGKNAKDSPQAEQAEARKAESEAKQSERTEPEQSGEGQTEQEQTPPKPAGGQKSGQQSAASSDSQQSPRDQSDGSPPSDMGDQSASQNGQSEG